MAIDVDRFKTINNNVKAQTEENGCIKDGQLASYVRCSMENKNLLQNKYDIYVGTDEYVGEVDSSGKYVSRETEGMNIIDAINGATGVDGASIININNNRLKIDYTNSIVKIIGTYGIELYNAKSNTVEVGDGTDALYFNGVMSDYQYTKDVTGVALKVGNETNYSSINIYRGDLLFETQNSNIGNSKIRINGNGIESDVFYNGQIGSPSLQNKKVYASTLYGTLGDVTTKSEVFSTTINADDIVTNSITANDSIATGSITATGEISALSFNATSDARLKTNIKPLEYHDSILDVPVREYDWKESGEHAIGFVAQELQKVYPELVGEGEDGMLRIKETKLVYLLIEEVKKLKEEVEKMKKEG